MSQTEIHSNIKKQINTNWYFRTGIVSLLYGISITITLFLTNGAGGEFIFSNWYQMLAPIPAFIGSQLSGATYIGRQIDAEKNKNSSDLMQKWAIYFGIGLGITIWALGFLSYSALDFFSGGIAKTSLAIAGSLCGLLADISSFAGFCGRIGSTIRYHGSFSFALVKERMPILIGTGLGLAASVTLWFLGGAALTTILGVTGFMSGGVIPALAGIFFIYRYTSAFTSAFDYCNRAHTYCSAYLKSILSDSELERETAKKSFAGKENQFRGAAIGIAVGVTLATIVVVALMVTQPYTIVLVAALGIYMASVGTFGGFFSRLGQMMDGVKKVPIDPVASKHEERATTQDAKASLLNESVLEASDNLMQNRLHRRRGSISFVEDNSEKESEALSAELSSATPPEPKSPDLHFSPIEKDAKSITLPPSPLSERDEHSVKILTKRRKVKFIPHDNTVSHKTGPIINVSA